MYYALNIIDVDYIMLRIKRWQMIRTNIIIESDVKFGEDTSKDNNMTSTLMNVSFFLKTLKLVLIIINTCYYTGMFWHIICEITLIIG